MMTGVKDHGLSMRYHQLDMKVKAGFVNSIKQHHFRFQWHRKSRLNNDNQSLHHVKLREMGKLKKQEISSTCCMIYNSTLIANASQR